MSFSCHHTQTRASQKKFIVILTHKIDCYEPTHKLLQPLYLDSQRITQSCEAIQAALENINTFFDYINSF